MTDPQIDEPNLDCNRLPILAGEIRAEHEAAVGAIGNRLPFSDARRCGRLLASHQLIAKP
jgi:hypothetical protein